jgi:hypothetical protein
MQLNITNELAEKLHTIYQHIDEHIHHAHDKEDADFVVEIANVYRSQKNSKHVETEPVEMKCNKDTDKYTCNITVELTREQHRLIEEIAKDRKIKIIMY